jgi:uncharacterized Zn finger protein
MTLKLSVKLVDIGKYACVSFVSVWAATAYDSDVVKISVKPAADVTSSRAGCYEQLENVLGTTLTAKVKFIGQEAALIPEDCSGLLKHALKSRETLSAIFGALINFAKPVVPEAGDSNELPANATGLNPATTDPLIGLN